MKKISALLVASLALLVFTASAQQARVFINAPANYDVAIDGRFAVMNNNSSGIEVAQGTHTMQVYQVISNGILGIGKKRNLLSTQQFGVGNNDVTINIDQNGRARISGNGNYGNTNNYPGQRSPRNRYPDRSGYPDRTDRQDRQHDHDRDYDSKNRKDEKSRYGRSEGKGNGNKYGHYKNKNNKHHKKSKRNNNNNRSGN